MNSTTALSVDNMNLADAMGFQASSSGSPQTSLYRVTVTVIQEVDKETSKIVSSPVFKIVRDEEEVYCRDMSVRFFAERQRWQKWDSVANNMQKSVMSNTLNADLKDTLGTFNLGRPSGYIKDFAALPDAQKDVIRSVNRVKVMMGMATLSDPFYEGGAPATGFDGEIPFVSDVKNRDSLKYIGASVDKLMRKSISPVEHTIILEGETRAMPNGNKYAVITSSLGELVGFADGDNDMLQSFVEYVQRSNEYILNKWDEVHVEGLSSEDADIVNSIVDVQDFE